MRKYESVVVFSPALSEEQLKKELKRFEGVLQNGGATSVVADIWGRKEMAHMGGKNKFGNYVCLNYDSDRHDIVDSLAHQLRITESVLKFQSHRINERSRKFKGRPNRKPQEVEWGRDATGEEADRRERY